MYALDGSVEKISPSSWFAPPFASSTLLAKPGTNPDLIAVGYNAYSYTQWTTDQWGYITPIDGNWFGQLQVYNRTTGLWKLLDEVRITRTRIVNGVSETYTVGTIQDIVWSQDGSRLAYVKGIPTATFLKYELWIINADGTGKRKIDESNSYGYEIRLSPTGEHIAYSKHSQSIWISDVLGNKQLVPSLINRWEKGFAWVSATSLLVQDDSSYTLARVDITDIQNPVVLAENVRSVYLSPDMRQAVLFYEMPEGKISVLDTNTGQISFQMQAPFKALYLDQNWGICTDTINWSGDGSKFVVLGQHTFEWYYHMWDAVILDLEKKTGSSEMLNITNSSETPHDSFWLDDNKTVLFSQAVIWPIELSTRTFNTATGVWNDLSGSLTFKREPRYSPRRTYLYSEWPESATRSTILTTLRSLQNLTTDLWPSRQKSAVSLRGTAADLNFDGYRLDYADARTPDSWQAIQPPSETMVINDLFTFWAPPYQGNFYVRLTASDKAGNTSISRKRVAWNASSSITGLYKSLDLFSPNGDAVKDVVELHYTVLEPVHLEFAVADDQGKVLRTFPRDHAAPEESFITWDGKDNAGITVPDGKYRISVLDFEFFVEVDNTPPDVHLALGPIVQDKEKQSISATLSGYAVDKNIRAWTVESEEDSNPGAWSPFKQGLASFSAKDETGAAIYPYQDALVDMPSSALGSYRGKKFRLTVEDLAGNSISATTGYLEEGIFLFTTKIDVGGGPLGTSEWIDDILSERREHELRRAVTTRHPLETLKLQYKINGAWTDGPAMPQPDFSSDYFIWDNTYLDRSVTFIRLKGVDVLGQAFYSNELPVMPLFILSFDCRTGLVAGILTDDKMSIVKFQVKGPGELQWTDYYVLTGIEAYYYSGYPRQAFEPNIMPGLLYQIRMTGVDVTGKPYESNIVSYPQKCAVQMKLEVRPEVALCGALSSGKTTLNAYDIKPSGPVSFKTLSYYAQLPSGPRFVQAFDLSHGGLGAATLDTAGIPEGSFTATAVLSYSDLYKGTMEEVSAAAALYVDRQLPQAAITYPAGSTVLCPLKNSSVEGDWYGVPVEGLAADGTGVSKYELYYGHGDNPEDWKAAVTGTGAGQKAISGTGPISGRIGTWNVTGLYGSVFSLKLRVVDVAGNTTCTTTVVSIKSLPEITAFSLDRKLISPNEDGTNDQVTAVYQLEGYATTSVQVHRLAQQGSNYVLDPAPLRTVQPNMQYLGGRATVTWDGSNDGGTIVSDGKYGIVLNATDSCGNTVQKWMPLEVDQTPPAAQIAYPQPQQPVGTVVEVLGTVDDLHFANYALEAGQGFDPMPGPRLQPG